MNAYDFDKTIYDGDSTADFYFFALKRHKKILTLLPSLFISFIKFYIFKIGTKTQFKEKMYRFLKYCDANKDVADFWEQNSRKIKKFYPENQKADDVIISASPQFLLEPICKKLGINNLIASKVDCKSGKYDGINCHGREKVRRFYEFFSNDSDTINFVSENEKSVNSEFIGTNSENAQSNNTLSKNAQSKSTQSKSIKNENNQTNNIQTKNEKSINIIINEFYSDSYSDEPMAKIAKKAFMVKKDKIYPWIFKS